MYGYTKLAMAVAKTCLADVKGNLKDIKEKIRHAEENKADIIAFPELSLTGYSCGDLFYQSALLNETVEGLRELADYSKEISAAIVVGAPLILRGQLYNCGVVLADGKILGVVPKTFLPNTNEFYEKRWFSSANELTFDSISERELGISEKETAIPVGNDLIFALDNEYKFSLEICEDLWSPIPPSCMHSAAGSEVIINISASNETVGKRQYRKELVKGQSARLMTGYCYVSAGWEESTSDTVFSGHSLICENGIIAAENENYVDSDYVLCGEIDIQKIRAERIKNKDIIESAVCYGKKCRMVPVKTTSKHEAKGESIKLNKLPFVPMTKSDRQKRCMEIFSLQVSSLKRRIMKTGGRPVLGISGGLDSTLALLVCVKAVEELGKDASEVVGITMPCFGTSDRTYNNAWELMRTLGITCKEINIKEACLKHFEDIGQDKNNYDLTFENAQARERTQVIMDYSGMVGGFVVGTGDLSELALGWCTYNGDHMSMYGVNGGVPKTLVRWMVDSLAQFNVFPKSSAVLLDILDTPISPELLPADEQGNISQQTEDIVGPYALHDFFIYYCIRYGFEPEKIYLLAKRAFKDDFSDEVILKWLKSFYKRFFTQQFKRSCQPDGVKIGSVGLGCKSDWRMPSDAAFRLWLDKAEELRAES